MDFFPNKLFHLDHFSRGKRVPYIRNWVYVLKVLTLLPRNLTTSLNNTSVPRPPGVLPQPAADRALRLPAHHEGGHPAAQEPLAQHQGARLLCPGHAAAHGGRRQAEVLQVLSHTLKRRTDTE